MSYTAGGDLEYVGYAAKGVAAGTSEWTLYKLTYTDSKLVSKQTAIGSWTGRAGASYE